jgi:hypothetical protein
VLALFDNSPLIDMSLNSDTNTTDYHDIIETLLKDALSRITLALQTIMESKNHNIQKSLHSTDEQTADVHWWK